MSGQDETDEDLLEFVGKENDPQYFAKVRALTDLSQNYQVPLPNFLQHDGRVPPGGEVSAEAELNIKKQCQEFFTTYLSRKLRGERQSSL